jgi:hypothetical protein
MRPTTPRARTAGALAGMGLLAIAVLLASAAYACVPQPVILIAGPGAGIPGDRLTVRGLRWGGAAELRWNAIDGPLLGAVSGADFVTEITIPPAAPGMYVIVVMTRGQDGSVGSIASAPVVVSGTSVASTAKASTPRPTSGPGVAVVLGLIGVAFLVLASAVVIAVRSRRTSIAVARPSAGVLSQP